MAACFLTFPGPLSFLHLHLGFHPLHHYFLPQFLLKVESYPGKDSWLVSFERAQRLNYPSSLHFDWEPTLLSCSWSWQTSSSYSCCSQTGLPRFPGNAGGNCCEILFKDFRSIACSSSPSAFSHIDVNISSFGVYLGGWGCFCCKCFQRVLFQPSSCSVYIQGFKETSKTVLQLPTSQLILFYFYNNHVYLGRKPMIFLFRGEKYIWLHHNGWLWENQTGVITGRHQYSHTVV